MRGTHKELGGMEDRDGGIGRHLLPLKHRWHHGCQRAMQTRLDVGYDAYPHAGLHSVCMALGEK